MPRDADARIAEAVEHGAGSIGRAVVDDDQLTHQRGSENG